MSNFNLYEMVNETYGVDAAERNNNLSLLSLPNISMEVDSKKRKVIIYS